jgi:acyl-CoA synthetase (NDP forming)
VRDGEKFIRAVGAARANGKPVVILKGGATAASAKAAAAHTGALVGEGRVWDAVFRREGVIQAHSLEQLIDIVLFLNSIDLHKLPGGKGVAIVAFGGGAGVLSADQCARHGLTTPALSSGTQEMLRPLVPPIAAIANPIDLTPQALNEEKWFDKFGPTLDAIAADPEIHTVLLQFGPVPRRGLEIAKEICAFRERSGKTVCIAWALPPAEVPPYLLSRGVHNFEEYERAIAVLGKAAASVAVKSDDPAAVEKFFDWAAYVPNPRPGQVIAEHECHRILAAAGLAVAAGRLATTEEAAIAAAEAVRTPVAMKGISSAVTHRAAAGLLALPVSGADEVRAAYRRLRDRASASGIVLDGVYVQHMVSGQAEVLISALRDPVFGVVVSCGAGGGLTELIDDVVLERAPVSERTALDMIERLRLARSVRKLQPAPDPAALARYIAQFSQAAACAPWAQFVLEVNPVKWDGDAVTAVDGLLIIEKP